MPELNDIINDLPAELQTGDDVDTGADDDAGADEDNQGDDNADNDGSGDEDEDASAGDDDSGAADEDDYVASLDEEEEKPAVPPPAKPVVNDENTYILQSLSKIQVRIVAADDSVKTVEVYGYGDLPRDMKGFASVYEQGIFNQSVIAQEGRAKELQTEFRQSKMQADTEVYVQKENRAIAEDLTELRQEGLFPKFKGVPGSKEFNESGGAKEFDRVVAYMNEQNDKYGKAATAGKAFRHIGFREAFIMLNGPNLKAAEKHEAKERRRVAGKLVSGKGASANEKNVSTKPVTNITELASEFEAFAGSSR